MRQPVILTALLGSALVFGAVMLQPAHAARKDAVSKGVVLTITAIDASKDMATLKSKSGKMYELPKGTSWKVGDKVECDLLTDDPSNPNKLQNCQPWGK